MENYYLMLDVGGTGIKAGLLTKQGSLYGRDLTCFAAKSDENKETIIQNFVQIIYKMAEQFPDKECRICGVGMAFPGPFDYERGRSLMRGLGKYDAIYGCDIRCEIMAYFQKLEDPNILAPNCPFLFLHDIEAFAIGMCNFGTLTAYDRIFCLCIGTGAGSAF
ncbi:MAG: ROK family protein, partial [Hungatella sp.]